ncbi:MAG: ParB/RepB/Spo0J family partition protein, partial [Candidatus Eisenbacteria bacterium]|nr:ParB/RepB/Spo0J family partition protein [Candidatus Eisenbacteria bacterium]
MHETVSPKPLADARLIPLAAIRTSPMNPRAEVAKEDFAELAASIKEKGVLEPILVRPSAKNGTAFEIVAGERRFRASRLAGLPAIPAVVREMTDAEAAEIALVENLHRKDIRALDEAAAYKKLQEQHRYSIEDVALKVGKSRAHVAARLRLLALSEAAKKAFLAGEMPPSVALLIARIPVAALAERATKEILHGGFAYGQPAGEPMTYRRAAEHVRRSYMLSLARAPFTTDDKTLVPDACLLYTSPSPRDSAVY